MPRFDNPYVLVARPQPASDGFVLALKDAAGPFRPLVSPAFELVPVVSDVPDFDGAIFTSKAGVTFAPKGRGRTAYCVGSATAQAAEDEGYSPKNAYGDVNDLIAMILHDEPCINLVHIRGEVSTGNVTDTLTSSGFRCSDYVTYRKSRLRPVPDVEAALNNKRDFIIPLFSKETASILASWRLDFGEPNVVAISAGVAEVAGALFPSNLEIAERPDLRSMVAATTSLIA